VYTAWVRIAISKQECKKGPKLFTVSKCVLCELCYLNIERYGDIKVIIMVPLISEPIKVTAKLKQRIEEGR
jgi:hypothetical protein